MDNLKEKVISKQLLKLHAMPGYLIRRCNQIALAILGEEIEEFDIKPAEFAILWAIQIHPSVDQTGLSDWLAIDRSSIARMVQGLEKRKLLRREADAADRRIKRLYPTDAGTETFLHSQSLVEKAQQRILSPLDRSEQRMFISLMQKLVQNSNEQSRAPLRLSVRMIH